MSKPDTADKLQSRAMAIVMICVGAVAALIGGGLGLLGAWLIHRFG